MEFEAMADNKRVSGFVTLRPNPLTRTSDTHQTLGVIGGDGLDENVWW